ncbi:3-oxoacyl-[acyl-carrier-protein] synthase 3 [Peptoclostridium acidaminophilum DSM 3953]|uniref:Beta-ketoacyl-[acyl-carrier-protein] synthase III n=1 Tax=Peptoclostridium acidaminophilum DSM 3953 TaxID=1286171 RepID=W8T3Z3_PEPAC|nr:beta-ketoacyl-ACP synthase III [Peptoclostridium acidaminophilum]AHM56484.1 3-oxoacyl-[acyl-carrier-protein] synthase 3 [Peptoclostridium acidaminophilum DSM 3953]
MKKAGIIGMGGYVPERVLDNLEMEKIVDTTDEWITSRTGIRQRRIASDSQATSDLAVEAAREALVSAGIKADELDLIIVATLTPDSNMPSTACIVQDKIGATRAAAFDLGAACSGFVYGLITGAQFIQTGAYKKVLVIGAETMSRVLDWNDRGTCVLFGDGAGAAVLAEVGEDEGITSFELGSDGSGAEFLIIPAGGSRMPATCDVVKERLNCLKMAGPEVFKFAVRIMADSAKRVVESAGLEMNDIDIMIPHQANTRIIESSSKKAGHARRKNVC